MKFININDLLQKFNAKVNIVKLKDKICIDETSLNSFLIKTMAILKKVRDVL